MKNIGTVEYLTGIRFKKNTEKKVIVYLTKVALNFEISPKFRCHLKVN